MGTEQQQQIAAMPVSLEEAARQALEALEYVDQPLNNETVDEWEQKTDTAITALRAALADQSLDKMAENAREIGLDYEPEKWEHLKAYGYAPGGYMMTCRGCNTTVIGVDKRASRCKSCATKSALEQPTEVIDPDSRTISVYEQPAQQEPVAKKRLMDCDDCGGTGVDGDVDDRGQTFDVQCRSCAGSGKSRYVAKCADGSRCLQGCYSTEGCYWEKRTAKVQPEQQELDELTAQRDQLADILTRTANALKGQPAELAQHSWHDLPEVAQKLKVEQQEPVAQKPYAYEYGVDNGDGTYSIRIDRGPLIHTGVQYEYCAPRNPHPEHPVTPLYTRPPACEPLTDEQFQAIKSRLFRQQGWDGDGWDLALKEAIEAAHGIKGDA